MVEIAYRIHLFSHFVVAFTIYNRFASLINAEFTDPDLNRR